MKTSTPLPARTEVPDLRGSGVLGSRRNRRVREEVQTAALKVDGSLALAAHAMQSLLRLDAHRVNLAGGDPVTNALLSEIEGAAIQQVKAIQADLFNTWGV